MQICVIGSGIVGASVAYRLTERDGVDVTVVDGNAPGAGTTAVSFAWVNANSKRPRDYFALNHAGMREYERLRAEWTDTGWLHPGGCLVTEEHIPGVADLVAELTSWGYAADLLDVARVNRDLEPGLALGAPDLPVAYFLEEFCVDAVRLTQALVRGATARGALLHLGLPVTAVDAHGSSFTVTLADGTSVTADAVVNAAGPDADAVGAMLGSAVPLASTWGMTVLLHAPGHPVGRVVHTGAVDLRPEGPDHLRVHWTPVDERLGKPGTDRAELTRDLVRRATDLVPGLTAPHVAASYAGVRPMPADDVSSVGPVPGASGCYEIATHSGITLGPLLGRLLTDEIVDGRVDPLLEPFRPDRFPGRSTE